MASFNGALIPATTSSLGYSQISMFEGGIPLSSTKTTLYRGIVGGVYTYQLNSAPGGATDVVIIGTF